MENVRLGGGIFPTLTNLNHSCDPNVIMINYGSVAVVLANRPIKSGEQIFDTYGQNFCHVEKEERQRSLKVCCDLWCSVLACSSVAFFFLFFPKTALYREGWGNSQGSRLPD